MHLVSRAADRAGGRPAGPLRPRRDHPYREQLQICPGPDARDGRGGGLVCGENMVRFQRVVRDLVARLKDPRDKCDRPERLKNWLSMPLFHAQTRYHDPPPRLLPDVAARPRHGPNRASSPMRRRARAPPLTPYAMCEAAIAAPRPTTKLPARVLTAIALREFGPARPGYRARAALALDDQLRGHRPLLRLQGGGDRRRAEHPGGRRAVGRCRLHAGQPDAPSRCLREPG